MPRPLRSRRFSAPPFPASRHTASPIDLLVEFGAFHRRPAALAADAVAHQLVVRPEFFARLFVGFGDVARRMHANRRAPACRAGRRRDGRDRHKAGSASGSPPMMASISGKPYRAARTTDSGVPPTPTQVFSVPVSTAGKRAGASAADAVCPPGNRCCRAARRTDRVSPRTAPRIARDRSRTAERIR